MLIVTTRLKGKRHVAAQFLTEFDGNRIIGSVLKKSFKLT